MACRQSPAQTWGNLANSVAAHAASAGLDAFVFIPQDLERGKIVASLIHGARVIGIRGAYDVVNRLCSEIAGKYGWGFVNVNLRPYYAEGSKSMGYESASNSAGGRPSTRSFPMASDSAPLHRGAQNHQEFAKLG